MNADYLSPSLDMAFMIDMYIYIIENENKIGNWFDLFKRGVVNKQLC